MVKWLLFDLAGTVAEPYWGNKKFLDVNGKQVETKRLYDLYKGERYEKFMIGSASEEAVLRYFLNKSKLNLDPDDIREIFRRYQYFLPGMRRLLSNLKKDHSLACLTNEGREWVQYKVDSLNLNDYFSVIIESNQLHVLKYSKKFFIKALKMLKAKPEDCIFIDDKEAICQVAEKTGIRSIVFKDSKQLRKELRLASI
jgi:putative hydrolase of the HAD superfamily